MNPSAYNNQILRERDRRTWNYVSNRSEFASRPNPSLHPGADFEQYFSGLFSEYILTKVMALFVGFILMFTLIAVNALNAVVVILVIWSQSFGLFFLLKICKEKTIQHKTGAFLRWLQCVAIIIFLLSLRIIPIKSLNFTSAVLYIVFYAITIGHDFLAPKFIHIYITKIKKMALLMRACIVLQLIIVLVQRNLSNPITWFAAFFPLYILISILLICTIVLIKNVFIKHRTQFWITEASHKKKGMAWILANLFALQALLLYGAIHVSSVLDGNSSQHFRPFLPLCISLILFCFDSLLFGKKGGGLNALGERVKEGVLKVFEGLASLSTADENHVSEERYVIKISNTYFKIATKKDIKQLKSKKVSAVSDNLEVEAGLRRMTVEMGMCMICCREVSNGVFMGCGHGGICFECGKEMINIGKECHLCREKIKSVLKVEMNNKKVLYKVLDEIKCEG